MVKFGFFLKARCVFAAAGKRRYGTLSIMDTRPRSFNAATFLAVIQAAEQVVKEIESSQVRGALLPPMQGDEGCCFPSAGQQSLGGGVGGGGGGCLRAYVSCPPPPPPPPLYSMSDDHAGGPR